MGDTVGCIPRSAVATTPLPSAWPRTATSSAAAQGLWQLACVPASIPTLALTACSTTYECPAPSQVNCSSRMESTSRPGKVQVSASTATLLARFPELFVVEPRGLVDIKGKGLLLTYWVSSNKGQA